jgi:hypothetical protein
MQGPSYGTVDILPRRKRRIEFIVEFKGIWWHRNVVGVLRFGFLQFGVTWGVR